MSRSPVIHSPETQLTLNFEPGISDKYKSLRECIASSVYRNGLGNTAIDLDIAPGNLSVQISDDQSRHFSVESLERFIAKTGDTTPIYYLIDKFLRESDGSGEVDMAALRPALKQMLPAMKKMGLI